MVRGTRTSLTPVDTDTNSLGLSGCESSVQAPYLSRKKQGSG